jgi:CRISPR system Cascade subunit CasE
VDGITIQRKTLFDAYRWKQELCKAVEPVGKEKIWPCRFVVKEVRNGEIVLFQSPTKPKILPFGTWETKCIPDEFYSNNQYLFEILANPTVKRVAFDSEGKRKRQGKNEGIDPVNNEAWIQKKLEDVGCKMKSVTVDPSGTMVCYKKGFPITNVAVKYNGSFIVKDKESFMKGVIAGIGRGKAFGFGLLLLKRI